MDVFDALLEAGVREKVFPGGAAWLGMKGRCLWKGQAGWASLNPKRGVGEDTFFDLASLTKVLGTTLALVRLVAQKKICPDDPLHVWLPEWKEQESLKAIRLYHLLQHTSGLPAHRPFYETLRMEADLERKRRRLHLIREAGLEGRPGERTLYSDLGFMLLGEVVERAGGRELGDAVMEALPEEAEGELFFSPLTVFPKERFAATGVSSVRRRRLVGEVHDENAAVVGGVDGHAGLFGTASAVGRTGMALVDAWHGRRGWCDPEVLRQFVFWPEDGRRPLGFDRPSGEMPSCGRFFSAHTVGHLGFTGCSLWMDMQREIVLVLLTNRVHYGDLHWKIRAFRPRFHDGVMQALIRAAKNEFCL